MKFFITLALLSLLACTSALVKITEYKAIFSVNLNDRSNDEFKVSLQVQGLGATDSIYQFAATAPGTYQIMDIGRYVSDFKAFDESGKELMVSKSSVNKYRLSSPNKIAKITYKIKETWDTPVTENYIYEMCGTSIEEDHVLINGQAVFGYILNHQTSPMQIKLDYPKEWSVGTALGLYEGSYYATSYDHAVDSPILLGRLSKATTRVINTDIEIYTYSKTDKIKSEMILKAMEKMLNAASSFVKGLPVDRYTFLYHFESKPVGAWEHSYSSEYVMNEIEPTEKYTQSLVDIAAHEFFHVVTPLNIHSEIIEFFNFENPTASRHLWLYEGTTEWSAHMMQLRSSMIDLETYLKRTAQKIAIESRFYDKNTSLLNLSLTSFTTEGNKQYGNIYQRGALVAGLLDIKLLELSKGTRSYRDVIIELTKKYGKGKSFNDATFFDDFTAITYPEIRDFLKNYVENASELPIAEYYNKIGINYSPEIMIEAKDGSLAVQLLPNDIGLEVSSVEERAIQNGILENDIIIKFAETKASSDNTDAIMNLIKQGKKGDKIAVTVLRKGKEKKLTVTLFAKLEKKMYYFNVNESASAEQVALRNAWLKNL